MMTWERVRFVGAVVLTSAALGCGGSGSSSGGTTTTTGPTPPGGTSTNSCRTYPTKANVHTTVSSSSITFDAIETGSFDSSTRKATVLSNFANGALCSTSVVSYNTVADFVDEVKVIPPITLAINNVNTNSGSCGTGTATTGYVYDSQRRVVQITNGTSAATTYTAWDSSGRPTAGTTGSNTLTLAYNDAARTVTVTQTGAQPSVGTMSFDANGLQTQIVLVQGTTTTTTTFTNTATATACK